MKRGMNSCRHRHAQAQAISTSPVYNCVSAHPRTKWSAHLVLQVALASLVTDRAVQRVVDLPPIQLSAVTACFDGSSCKSRPRAQPCSNTFNNHRYKYAHQQELHDALTRFAHYWRFCLHHHVRRCGHGARRHWLGRLLNLRRAHKQRSSSSQRTKSQPSRAVMAPCLWLASLAQASCMQNSATQTQQCHLHRGEQGGQHTSTRHMRQLPAMDRRW